VYIIKFWRIQVQIILLHSIVSVYYVLRKAGDHRQSLGTTKLLKRDKRFSLPPAEHAIVRIFDYATGAVSKRKGQSEVTILPLQSVGARLASPRHFFGPLARNWSPRGAKSLFVIVSYVSVVAHARIEATAGNPQSRFESARDRRTVRTSVPRDVTSDANRSRTERSEGNLVCVPASNRESKKVIGLTRGRNSASDLIHKLGMEFVLLSIVGANSVLRDRRVFIQDTKPYW